MTSPDRASYGPHGGGAWASRRGEPPAAVLHTTAWMRRAVAHARSRSADASARRCCCTRAWARARPSSSCGTPGRRAARGEVGRARPTPHFLCVRPRACRRRPHLLRLRLQVLERAPPDESCGRDRVEEGQLGVHMRVRAQLRPAHRRVGQRVHVARHQNSAPLAVAPAVRLVPPLLPRRSGAQRLAPRADVTCRGRSLGESGGCALCVQRKTQLTQAMFVSLFFTHPLRFENANIRSSVHPQRGTAHDRVPAITV